MTNGDKPREGGKSISETGGKPEMVNGKAKFSADAEIGRKLREYYDSIISEEVPDRFARLLVELEKTEQGKDGTDS